MAHLSELLIDDHAALDRLLKQLQAALQRSDVETAHAKLDLFWARLAVHIRAEHLHLFPAVLTTVKAQTLVTELRQDHDFFMHELARAVEIMRELLTVSEQSVIKVQLHKITKTMLEVEQRLVKHNEVEESQIYDWASTLLSAQEQEKLIEQIKSELQNRPARFAADTWSDE